MIGNIIAGLQDAGVVAVGDFESIATVTVGSGGASNIEFTNIPQTYQHLQLRGIGRDSASGVNDTVGMVIQYNGDTGNNYSSHFLFGQGTSAAAFDLTSQTNLYSGYVPQNGSTSNCFSGTVIDILDYSNTNKFTTQRSLNGNETNNSSNANSRITLLSGLWRNTNAVTSIKIYTNGSGFMQYSTFALYGIKG